MEELTDAPIVSARAPLQQRMFEILEKPRPEDRASRHVNRLLMALILFNIVAVICESIGTLQLRYQRAFQVLEYSSLLIFAVEYLARVWVSVRHERFRHPLVGRLKYMISPMALIDLAAIIPALFTGLASDFRFLRALRVLRMLRIWKLTRYSKSLQIVRSAVVSTANQLVAVAAVLIVIVIVASGLMFMVEHPIQPEKFSSMLSSIWWTLETLTMIHYDNVAPITPVGKFLGLMIGLMGIGMFAMPAGILASAFLEELTKRSKDQPRCCPKCGAPVSADDLGGQPHRE